MLYVKKYNPENMLKFPFESFISDAEKLMRNQFTEEKTIIKYPLTNIGYVGKKLVFEVALAGFKPENIKLTKKCEKKKMIKQSLIFLFFYARIHL